MTSVVDNCPTHRRSSVAAVDLSSSLVGLGDSSTAITAYESTPSYMVVTEQIPTPATISLTLVCIVPPLKATHIVQHPSTPLAAVLGVGKGAVLVITQCVQFRLFQVHRGKISTLTREEGNVGVGSNIKGAFLFSNELGKEIAQKFKKIKLTENTAKVIAYGCDANKKSLVHLIAINF